MIAVKSGLEWDPGMPPELADLRRSDQAGDIIEEGKHRVARVIALLQGVQIQTEILRADPVHAFQMGLYIAVP